VLRERYGEESDAHLARMFEASGLGFNPPEEVPRSRRALEATELARERGLHEPVHTRLMRAYWSEGQNIGDDEVLFRLLEEEGLDRAEVETALDDGRFADRVTASTQAANRLGINAIPAFVLGERLLVLGAQPHEMFEQAAAQLEAAST
jgi:predicted DsbA family dithiol-disulfide isomerase